MKLMVLGNQSSMAAIGYTLSSEKNDAPALVGRAVFAPIGIVAGLLAGLVAQKGFERIWAVFDDEEPPEPGQSDAPLSKLVPALLIEGAIFRLTKGLVDRGARSGFGRLTGKWPGDDGTES